METGFDQCLVVQKLLPFASSHDMEHRSDRHHIGPISHLRGNANALRNQENAHAALTQASACAATASPRSAVMWA